MCGEGRWGGGELSLSLSLSPLSIRRPQKPTLDDRVVCLGNHRRVVSEKRRIAPVATRDNQRKGLRSLRHSLCGDEDLVLHVFLWVGNQDVLRVVRVVPPGSTVGEEGLAVGRGYLEVEVVDEVLVAVRRRGGIVPDQCGLEREHVSGLALDHSQLVLARLAGREALHIGKVADGKEVPLRGIIKIHCVLELQETMTLLLPVVSAAKVVACQELGTVDHNRFDERSHRGHDVVGLAGWGKRLVEGAISSLSLSSSCSLPPPSPPPKPTFFRPRG